LIADFAVTNKQQTPNERTCGYWMVNNHNGTKKELRSFTFIAKYCFSKFYRKAKSSSTTKPMTSLRAGRNLILNLNDGE